MGSNSNSVCTLSPVQLFVIPRTVAHQAPLHRIFQKRILEWVAIYYSRETSQPRDQPAFLASPAVAGRFFITVPPRKPPSQRVPRKNLKDEEGKKPAQFLTLLSTNILFVIY